MEIAYASERIEKVCNNNAAAKKLYGLGSAKKLLTRLEDLATAETLEDVRYLAGNCHELQYGRAGQLAMKLEGGWRLVFTPTLDPLPRTTTGGLDWSAVTAIAILEIIDYHKG